MTSVLPQQDHACGTPYTDLPSTEIKLELNSEVMGPPTQPVRKSVLFKPPKAEDVNFVSVLRETRASRSLTDGYRIIMGSVKYLLTGQRGNIVIEPVRLLCELTKVTSLLDGYNEPVVTELFKVKLLTIEVEVLELYLSFLLELGRTNSFHYPEVARVLLQSMTSIEDDVCPEAKLDLVHGTVKVMIKELPQFNRTLLKQVGKCLPYMTRSWKCQVNSYRNMLRIADYIGRADDSLDIIFRLIHRIIDFDCHCPKGDLVAAEETIGDGGDDTITQFKMDTHETLEVESKVQVEPEMKHSLGNSFDRVMEVMLDYIDVHFREPEDSKRTYKLFLAVFDKYILTTYKCLHIQYLMFYICSKRPLFSDHFIDFLWDKVQNPNTSVVFRQIAVYYIGSFLCRAKFIAVGTLKDSLSLMCRYLRNYIAQSSGAVTLTVDIARHGTFYSVCQTVLYCVAFRHKDISESQNGLQFLRSLNLEQLITSPINPLKVIALPIVTNFANVSRHYQIVYCHSIIEKNQRSALPMANASMQMLETYFPFDPYVLCRSRRRIEPLYREYIDHLSVDEDSDEDDEEMVSTSCKSDAEKIFAYSVSPGFVH